MQTPEQPPQVVPTNMRLRGKNPAIEVSASNMSFLLGEMAPEGVASMSIRKGTTMNSSTAFYHVRQAPLSRSTTDATGSPGGVAICGTDVASTSFVTTAASALAEPFVSLRTFADIEYARVSGAGLSCDSLTAQSFTNLVGDYVTTSAFVPPSAAALNRAYVDLSNQIVLASLVPPKNAAFGGLVDDFHSDSVLNAPTANALRGAFHTLSNLFSIRLGAMQGQLTSMVQSTSGNVLAAITKGIVSAAIVAASNDGNVIAGGYSSASSSCPSDDDDGCCSPASSCSSYEATNKVIVVYVGNAGGSNSAGGSNNNNNNGDFLLVNDKFIYTPDGEARFYFKTTGVTTLAAAGNRGSQTDTLAFSWLVNDANQNVMTLSGKGALWVRDSLDLGGAATLRSNLEVVGGTTLDSTVKVKGTATFLGDVALLGQTLTMGSQVQIRYAGSNIGINLPSGIAPVCALHVNGSVFSEEGLYELSDQSVKTDIVPLTDALDKCMRIRGCSYQRTDIPLRQIGVIAQNVNQVVPEAVHVGSDGRMSVAYGNLVALAIEAIREVSQNQLALAERLRRLEHPDEEI